jgi:hypothetical protein
LLATVWPPTGSRGASVLWAFLFGFVLQLIVPASLALLGFPKGALLAMYPGFLLILWATGGWFARISPLGYLILDSINTVAYARLVYVTFRFCKLLNAYQ